MWQIKDSKLVSKFNIIIKNLPKNITSKELSSLFSRAGNIFSCKIPLNSKSNSEGFGFVCFYDEESVKKSIDELNNTEYKSKKITVERYDKKHSENKETPYNNLYVKNFPKTYKDEDLEDLFKVYGKITSVKIEFDNENNSKGFAFVCFENGDHARTAINELNGKKINDLELYVNKFEKKSERTRKLKLELTKMSNNETNNNKTNLYVKYISDAVDEEALKKEFEAYGNVTSVKIERELVKKDEKEYLIHRGYGYVAFEKAEEALVALENMNGKVVLGKPLYVTYLMAKEQRKHMLSSMLSQGGNNKFMQNQQKNH